MQYTLLPELERLHLYKEYRIRALIVLLLALSFVGVIGIATSFPIFVRAYLEERAILSKTDSSTFVADQSFINIKKELTDDATRLSMASSYTNNQNFSVEMSRIIALRGSIKIVSMTMSRGNSISIILRGVAPTRDLLLAFKKRLYDNLSGATVDLPISELTKSVDLSFSIQINNIQP